MSRVSSARFAPGSKAITTPSVTIIIDWQKTIQKRRGPKRSIRTRSTTGPQTHLNPHGA